MFAASDLAQRYQKHIPLLVALLLAAPIIFFQAFRYSFPLGYAGMFTLIAEKIAESNFQLPMSIPHYGPAGIPLVYPPLGMYVFALAIKLGIPIWFYLRVIPAIFTLLSIIPLYYLTLELVESKVASILAVVFVITAPAVYYTHVWAAGLVRALALFFCLAGLFFYVRSLRDFSTRAPGFPASYPQHLQRSQGCDSNAPLIVCDTARPIAQKLPDRPHGLR